MTGYTQMIAENDNVSFKDFALRCARYFGALIDMRDKPLDAPIPERFEVDEHYRKNYEWAKDNYEKFIANPPTYEQMEKRYNEYVAEETEKAKQENEKRRILRAKYEVMLIKVRKWIPPTPEYDNLKSFMIQQLEDSIDWDCDEYELNIPNKDEWIECFFSPNSLKRRMYSRLEDLQKEIARTERNNRWLKDLRESLEGID